MAVEASLAAGLVVGATVTVLVATVPSPPFLASLALWRPRNCPAKGRSGDAP